MVTKKAAPKKRTTKLRTKTTTAKSAKRIVHGEPAEQPMRSFKLYRDKPEDFMTFRVTRQTLYWSILLIFIIVMQMWILQTQLEIAALTESLLNQ